MRKALWLLSAPVVAGGLAWAVNAADDSAPRSAKATTGKVFYFSRPAGAGKATADAAAGREAIVADDEADSEAEETPTRYSRARAVAAAPAGNGARSKNLYQDLFGEGAPETEKAELPKATARPTDARQAAARKPAAPTAAAPRTPPRKPLADSFLSEASPEADADGSGEENPLPGFDEQIDLLKGTAEKADIRQADHKTPAGAARRTIKQVQGTDKGTAKRAIDDGSDLFDEEDWTAPAAPAAKTAKAPVKRPVAAPAATTNRTTSAAAPRAAAKAPAAEAKARPEAKVEPGAEAATARSSVSQAASTAVDTSDVPMVALKWVKHGDVNVGQECKCGLVVKNSGKMPAKDIVVEAFLPKTVRLVHADPIPSDTRDHLTWAFDHLEAGAERTMEITLIPVRRGDLSTTATVRFSGVATANFKVEEPQLAVAIAGPKEVVVGDTTTQMITVSNSGTGVAHEVVVHASIPDGLEHQRGKNVELSIGSLGPGETREIRLPLAAKAGGNAVVKIEARGENLSQKTQTTITVAAPKLKVDVAGPSLRYVNRNAQYTVTVTNDGVAATDNVSVMHLIPAGFEFVKADRGGKFDESTSSVKWFVGRLEAGQSLQVAADLSARKIGSYQHHVQASGEGGTIAAARLDSKVDGASALVMEVSDLADPIEIGTQTAYEIRIRNDGSKAAQNLKLVCELPKGVELIDTEGPSAHKVVKDVLEFAAIGELPVGGKVTYRVKVNGKVAGNLRLRAKLTSNAIPEPLVVEELTRFYAD